MTTRRKGAALAALTVAMGLFGLAAQAGSGNVAKIVEIDYGFESIAGALASATAGQTIQLLTDVTEDVTIEEDKTNTLDLAGWVLKGDGSAPVIKIGSSDAVITVRDTSAGRTGAITTGGAGYAGNGAGIDVENGSLSLYGVTITNCVASGNGGAVYGAENVRILVKDCLIKGNSAGDSGGGIYMKGGTGPDGAPAPETTDKLVLISTVITENKAVNAGAGIYFKKTAKNASCFVAGTRVTMADGTTKAIEEIQEGDVVRTFDHEGGTNSSARVYLAFAGEAKALPFTLWFDEGDGVRGAPAAVGADLRAARLSIVGCHDLLLRDTRKYVTLTEANAGEYVGAAFYGEDGAWHTLTNVTMGTEAAAYYSLYTAQHQNVYANGLLTVADDVDYLLNIYELDENLKADATELAADVAAYGYFAYETAAAKGMSRAWYDDAGTKYLNVAVGKGLVSLAYCEALFASLDGGRGATALPATTGRALSLLGAAAPTLDDFAVGVLTLGADVIVTNNTLTGGSANNIYLVENSGESLVALAASHEDICAGVTLANGTGAFTTNVNVTATDTQYFTSDNPAYVTRFVTDHLELVAGIQVGDAVWAYLNDGVCTIRGTGATWAKDDWLDGNPLKAYAAAITNLVVESGITGLGANSFENMWYLQNVTLGADVTSVGDRAFRKCYGLTNVTSQATGTAAIGDYAFSGCHSLKGLSFAGDPTFGTQSYTLQAAIYMKDGGIPEVYAMPAVTIAGKSEHIMGKRALNDTDWTDVTSFTDAQKKEYHFFKIEMK